MDTSFLEMLRVEYDASGKNIFNDLVEKNKKNMINGAKKGAGDIFISALDRNQQKVIQEYLSTITQTVGRFYIYKKYDHPRYSLRYSIYNDATPDSDSDSD